MTGELAVDWASDGVRVNALVPGWFATEMTADLCDNDRGRGWIARNTPLGWIGAVEDLDGALMFLASDASTFCAGSTLVVDGGWTAH